MKNGVGWREPAPDQRIRCGARSAPMRRCSASTRGGCSRGWATSGWTRRWSTSTWRRIIDARSRPAFWRGLDRSRAAVLAMLGARGSGLGAKICRSQELRKTKGLQKQPFNGWRLGGSNPWPRECHSRALPAEL